MSLPMPDRSRWTLLRAGLHNLWEYDDHVFVFSRGRLILRGRNEAGKSKALELLLPFLLDASIRPERLDPFGSTSRKMRWNLIGHDPDASEKVRIGYAWVEFGRVGEDGPEFFTIGVGLRARTSTPSVDQWYFTTRARPGAELTLVARDQVVLSRKRLAEVMGNRGVVYPSAAAYRQALNRILFGLDDAQYDSLIKALLQLRRPQLSKALDPAELSKVLSWSLPPLDAGIVGRLAEGFEQLERERARQAQLAYAQARVKTLLSGYRRYLRIVARQKALALDTIRRQRKRILTHHREADAALVAATEAAAGASARRDAAAQQLGALEQQKDTLLASDAYRAVERIDRAQSQLREHRRTHRRAREASSRAASAHRDRQRRLDQLTRQLETQQAAVQQQQRVAAAAASEAALDVLERLVSSAAPAAASGVLAAGLQERAAAIGVVEEASGALRRARRDAQDAERSAEDTAEAYREADERQHEAARLLRAAEETLLAQMAAWQHAQPSLSLPEELLELPWSQWRAQVQQRAAADEEEQSAALADAQAEQRTLQAEHTRLDADIEALRSAPLMTPPAPPWRQRGEREGAPLYRLCEFREDVPLAQQAALEGALEASGLLDAWVTPSPGEIPSGDLTLVGQPASGRASLASVLRPTPAGGVGAERIRSLLEQIPLSDDGIGGEGRWRLGPLAGQLDKPAVEYVGQTAQQQTRARRLAALADHRQQCAERLAVVGEQAEALRDRQRRLRAALGRLPTDEEIQLARGILAERTSVSEESRARWLEAQRRHQQARQQLEQQQARLHAIAQEQALAGWADALPRLRALTQVYQAAAQRGIDLGLRLADGQARVAQLREDLEDAAEVLALAEEEEQRSADLEARLLAEVQALQETIGASVQAIQQRLQEIRLAQLQARQELQDAQQQREAAQQARSRAEEQRSRHAEALQDADAQREAAAQRLMQIIGAPRLWSVIGIGDGEPDSPIEAARAVVRATQKLDADEGARDRAQNSAVEHARKLFLERIEGLELESHLEGGLQRISARLDGTPLSIAGLHAELGARIERAQRRLSDQERRVIESFLTGETNQHLRQQLVTSNKLIAHMNQELGERPTPGGTRLRLRWELSADAPEGAAGALRLLQREGSLLSGADRAALEAFLQAQLAAARASDTAGALHTQMLERLDYRQWFSFIVETQQPGRPWKRLTRRAHGAGSGGQKAVTLHLPLFAAASAFYASGHPHAARLILLDEAFAGIDRPMRGALMGSLVAFDLDFVMTSYDEWGAYPQLDGCAVYSLHRQRGFRGVHAERFEWTGTADGA